MICGQIRSNPSLINREIMRSRQTAYSMQSLNSEGSLFTGIPLFQVLGWNFFLPKIRISYKTQFFFRKTRLFCYQRVSFISKSSFLRSIGNYESLACRWKTVERRWQSANGALMTRPITFCTRMAYQPWDGSAGRRLSSWQSRPMRGSCQGEGFSKRESSFWLHSTSVNGRVDFYIRLKQKRKVRFLARVGRHRPS